MAEIWLTSACRRTGDDENPAIPFAPAHGPERRSGDPISPAPDAIVYDVKACLILYKSERITSDAAKVSAVEFALVHLYGPGHGKDAEALAGSPAWHLLSDDE